MGEASMYDCIFLILLFYMYICILYVDILSNKSIYLSVYSSLVEETELTQEKKLLNFHSLL